MHLGKSAKDILRDLTKHIEELAQVEQITVKNDSAGELARFYLDVRNFYDQLHDVSKELTKLKDQMAYKDVPAAFEREHLATLTLKEGYRVTISALVRASCKEMSQAIAWCYQCECGHHGVEHDEALICRHLPQCNCKAYNAPNAGLVKETINAQTLAAFARAEGEEGRELPDDIFTVSIGQNTSVTKVS